MFAGCAACAALAAGGAGAVAVLGSPVAQHASAAGAAVSTTTPARPRTYAARYAVFARAARPQDTPPAILRAIARGAVRRSTSPPVVRRIGTSPATYLYRLSHGACIYHRVEGGAVGGCTGTANILDGVAPPTEVTVIHGGLWVQTVLPDGTTRIRLTTRGGRRFALPPRRNVASMRAASSDPPRELSWRLYDGTGHIQSLPSIAGPIAKPGP